MRGRVPIATDVGGGDRRRLVNKPGCIRGSTKTDLSSRPHCAHIVRTHAPRRRTAPTHPAARSRRAALGTTLARSRRRASSPMASRPTSPRARCRGALPHLPRSSRLKRRRRPLPCAPLAACFAAGRLLPLPRWRRCLNNAANLQQTTHKNRPTGAPSTTSASTCCATPLRAPSRRWASSRPTRSCARTSSSPRAARCSTRGAPCLLFLEFGGCFESGPCALRARPLEKGWRSRLPLLCCVCFVLVALLRALAVLDRAAAETRQLNTHNPFSLSLLSPLSAHPPWPKTKQLRHLAGRLVHRGAQDGAGQQAEVVDRQAGEQAPLVGQTHRHCWGRQSGRRLLWSANCHCIALGKC